MMWNLRRYAMTAYARVYFFSVGYRNGGLPCWHCVFVRDAKKYSFTYPVWVSCTNPEFGGYQNDGCNWGEL